MTLIIDNGARQIRIKGNSATKMLAVADQLNMAIFRMPHNVKYGGEWHGRQWATYWCERMVTLGVAERKRRSRGWYTWTAYRLTKSYGEIADILGSIPF